MGRTYGHREVTVFMAKEVTSFLNKVRSGKKYHFLPAPVMIPVASK
jgi:hypothetical protein